MLTDLTVGLLERKKNIRKKEKKRAKKIILALSGDKHVPSYDCLFLGSEMELSEKLTS